MSNVTASRPIPPRSGVDRRLRIVALALASSFCSLLRLFHSTVKKLEDSPKPPAFDREPEPQKLRTRLGGPWVAISRFISKPIVVIATVKVSKTLLRTTAIYSNMIFERTQICIPYIPHVPPTLRRFELNQDP